MDVGVEIGQNLEFPELRVKRVLSVLNTSLPVNKLERVLHISVYFVGREEK